MSSPAADSPAERIATLYSLALAALACDDVAAAIRAVDAADQIVGSLEKGQPSGADLADLHARLTRSAQEMRDRTTEKQAQLACARRMVRGYAASLASSRSRFDAKV